MANRERAHIMVFIAVSALAVAIACWRRRRQRRTRSAERVDGQVEGATSLCRVEFEKKPQNSFKWVLADNSYAPFKHFKREGREKEISLRVHPYEDEITLLLEQPFDLPKFAPSHEPTDLGASFVWISKEDQLESLAEILNEAAAFAVDTEQHSLHSFLGFTALMQISTKEHDFLLDAIALHDVMGILRPIFSNPSICKVFHGSHNDILWLQRDFHIYVVNAFDTAKACQVLSKPQKPLAYLLEIYCGVSTDKSLQREDWRLRPLSPEMVQYARTDAHYLLYIADCLIAELKGQSHACEDGKSNLVHEASRQSNMVCLQLHSKGSEPSSVDSTAASILSRYSTVNGCATWNNSEARELIRQLCIWRDLMARIHDESLRCVLSDQAIFYLAINSPQTPEEVYDTIVLADSNLNLSDVSSIPPSPSYVVKGHMKDLCGLIQKVAHSPDDVFRGILQACLDPSGDCPLSLYNYALLSELDLKASSVFSLKQSGGNFRASVGRKASRELFVQKFSCKSPVYHNCRIFASDGRLLCYCDRRKLEWYLHRGLARIVVDDPPAIMLLFEPKGRPEDENNEFYIQSKKNMCVGCGERNHYLRYRIIPSCYRMHFPEHLKSHRSHDIVLLCVDCHEIAHSASEKHKKQIASEFGVPLFVRRVTNSGESECLDIASGFMEELGEVGVSPLQLRTAAMALLRHGSKLPSTRREELVKIVRAYFGGREISEEDLETVLLVGMSPRERRRLEKKRGLPVKSCDATKTALQENISTMVIKDDVGNDDPAIKSTSPFLSPESHQFFSSKTSKKISLLGHGPHGKQVVEHLLKEYGEEGILQFCQRWRQVFVEAINPRFLPTGWDIMHRGRREFGEYSVYNPSNKDVDMIKTTDESQHLCSFTVAS